MKTLHKSIGRKPCDIGLEFCGCEAKSQAAKAKIDRWDYVKPQISLESRKASRMEETIRNRRRYLQVIYE
jgi:hypothetical protein